MIEHGKHYDFEIQEFENEKVIDTQKKVSVGTQVVDIDLKDDKQIKQLHENNQAQDKIHSLLTKHVLDIVTRVDQQSKDKCTTE